MTGDDFSDTKVSFYNLTINVLDRQAFFRELRQSLLHPHKVIINFLNAHCFNVAQRNLHYRDALKKSTFLLNDGVGVNIAGRLVGIKFKENLNGTDLIPQLLKYFADKKMTVFCYGASHQVIAKAVRKIEIDIPHLAIVGFSDGYVDDPDVIIDQINQSQADAVILGMGVPRQELWVASHSSRLTSAKVFVSGGAIFDFLSGNAKRAPLFVRRIKLEWLFRLIQEPRRLFSRYVIGSFIFLYYIALKRY